MVLENDEICLRAPEPEDLEVMFKLENDAQAWEQGCTTVPFSHFLLRQYIEQATGDIYTDKQARLMIGRKSDGAVLGCADLVNYEPMHQRAEVGIIVVSEHRNKGVGKAALEILCRYAFDGLHLHQLAAYVAADNLASLKLFKHCGFGEAHLLKDWLRHADGGYKDAWLLQKIKGR